MTPMTPEEFGGAPGAWTPPHCVAALLTLVAAPPLCGGLIFDAAWSTPQAASAEALRSLYRRSEAVRRYVLARAAGACESCNQPASFITLQGEPYLEPHHTRRLSDGGPDDPRFVGALCPGCHREVHHGALGQRKNDALIKAIRQKEESLGP